jgi:hypothetical protein
VTREAVVEDTHMLAVAVEDTHMLADIPTSDMYIFH